MQQRLRRLAPDSLDKRDKQLGLFDDIRGELRGAAILAVLDRVDSLGRDMRPSRIAYSSTRTRSSSNAESEDPVAYRRYARQQPHLCLMTATPLPPELCAPGAEHRPRRPALRAVRDDPDPPRALRGCVHGLSILERNDCFPPDGDLDAAREHGLDAFRGGPR